MAQHQCWACYQTGGPYQRRAQCGVCFQDWGADLSLAPLLSPTTLLTARDADSAEGASAPQADDARSSAQRAALRGDGERGGARPSPQYGALGATPAGSPDGGAEFSWSGDSPANARMRRKPASRARAAGAFAALFAVGLLVASRVDLGSTTRVVTSVGDGGGDGAPPTADADATAAAATVAQVVEGFEPPEVVTLSPPAVAAVVADAIADAAADAGAASGAATNAATGEKASARGARGREDEDAASEPDASTEEIARPEGDAKLTADNGGCDADKTSSHGQPCDTEDAASSATTSGGVITFEDRMRLILEEKGLIERGAILPFEQARLETASRSPPSRARVRRR